MLVHHVGVLLVDPILHIDLPLLSLLHRFHMFGLHLSLPLDHFLLHLDLFFLDLPVYPVEVTHNKINIS
jgi:hypothetical protein